MAGKVVMYQGGTYYIGQHPNWRRSRAPTPPATGTSTRCDWALPLLYRGVHKQNPVLVERFRQLIYYWINDHKGKRGAWVDGSIYGGMRRRRWCARRRR